MTEEQLNKEETRKIRISEKNTQSIALKLVEMDNLYRELEIKFIALNSNYNLIYSKLQTMETQLNLIRATSIGTGATSTV